MTNLGDKPFQKNLRVSKRNKRKLINSVKPIDEELAEKGLLKLAEVLSGEVKPSTVKIEAKKESRIITRRSRNLRSNKNKDIVSNESAESPKESNITKTRHKEKESKIAAVEEGKKGLLAETVKSAYLQEEVKLTPVSVKLEPVDKRVKESSKIQQMVTEHERSRKNNSLHGVIASLIEKNKEKVRFNSNNRK